MAQRCVPVYTRPDAGGQAWQANWPPNKNVVKRRCGSSSSCWWNASGGPARWVCLTNSILAMGHRAPQLRQCASDVADPAPRLRWRQVSHCRCRRLPL